MIRLLIFMRLQYWHQGKSYHVWAWWRHQMETFSTLLVLCERNLQVTGGFPSKGQWRGALIFLFAPEQTVKQTTDTPVIWDATAFIMT